MSNVSDFSVGVVHELTITAAKAGFTPDEFGALAKKPELLRQFRQVLLGHASVQVVEHVIDCDADPFVPDGWKVEEHQKGGQIQFDPSKVELWLAKGQQNGKAIEGNKLRKELAKMPALNANVLDYLLANPHLIPEDWKKDGQGNTRYIFFWGTVYRNSHGNLYVRYLCWDDDGWRWSYRWLAYSWDGNYPAAVRAVELRT